MSSSVYLQDVVSSEDYKGVWSMNPGANPSRLIFLREASQPGRARAWIQIWSFSKKHELRAIEDLLHLMYQVSFSIVNPKI